MSTNIEPIVNNLMSNKTSSSLLKDVDASLLNPYNHLSLSENRNEEKINNKETYDKSDHKKSEDLSFSNKLDKIQNQLKNETIKELKDLKDQLIELPGLKHHINNKKSISKSPHVPIIDDFASNFKLFNFKENQNPSPHSIFDKYKNIFNN
jgi:hypothetical protein